MRKLTSEEKRALQEKIREAGLEERSKLNQITLSDDKKEEMKKLIAEADRERLERLDKSLHSRSKSKE